MDFLLRIYPGDDVAFLLGSVLVQVTVIVLVSWGITSLAARRSAATRHGIWLCSLVTALLSPIATVGIHQTDFTVLSVADSSRVPPVEIRMPSSATPESFTEESPPVLTSPPRTTSVPARLSAGDILRAMGSAALCVWVAGMLCFLVRFLHGCFRLRNLCRGVTPLSGVKSSTITTEVCEALSAHRLPRIVTSRTLRSPIAVGIVRPMVVLPERMVEVLQQDQLREVLLHECAHIMRRDPVVGLLQRLAEMLYWPHPFVHMLNRKLARAREEACDDYVLSRSDGRNFGRTLCELSEQLSATGLRPAALGLFEPRWQLEERVAGLLDARRDTMSRVNRPAAGTTLVGLVMVVLVIGATGSLVANSEESENTTAEKSRPGQEERAPVSNNVGEPKEALRYDGKDFAWWKKQLFTELKAELRAEALKAMGVFGANGYAEEATAAIMEIVKAYDIGSGIGDAAKVSQAAGLALRKIGPPAIKTLTAALRGENANARRFAARVLNRFPTSDDALSALIAATQDPDPKVRRDAVGALPPYGKEAVSALTGALKDEEYGIRYFAARGLRQIGPSAKSAVGELVAGANDERPAVRRTSLMALNSIDPDPKVVIPTLIERLKDEDGNVQQEAINYLGRLGPQAKEAVPALLEAFSEHRNHRVGIARALGKIGPDAKEAIPLLTEAMQDENDTLRRFATDALKKIAK